MKALMSSMAGLALIVSGAAWAGEHDKSQGSQGQKPFKSSETYAPSGETADPGMTEGQTRQAPRTGQESEKKSAAGQYVDDAMITAKVKAALAQSSQTSAMAISVETTNQTVALTGSVKSQDEKEKAESIARSVTGVKKVDNQLTVEG